MANNAVEIGGRKLVVGPACLYNIKRWLRAQKEVALGSLEYTEELGVFIGDTLRRTTPDLDQDWLERHLDEHTIPVTLRMIYTAGRIESGEPEGPQS